MDVKQSQGEPRLLISRSALLYNVLLIRQQLKPSTKICAMIKADAYGHGAEAVIDTLCNFEYEGLASPAVDQLGVACLDEAAELPAETTLPVLVLRAVENVYIGRQRSLIEHAIRSGWILTLGTCAAADDVARIAISTGKRASIHVMIDTGMTRCGCSVQQLPELLTRIESHTSLRLTSLGSHFATADVKDDACMGRQFSLFCVATDATAARLGNRIIRTISNSGGTFFCPEAQLDMVRPGISLYGIDPTCRPHYARNLKPVAKWTAPIVSILDAKQHTGVGYGQTWKTPRDTRIGLVPVGYADGYLRCFGNRASMIVNGVACPVVGRVSMDLTSIDLHDVPSAKIGDEVVVMDSDPLSPASAYTLAELGQTIPYELFTRIGRRVKRVAVDRLSTPTQVQMTR